MEGNQDHAYIGVAEALDVKPTSSATEDAGIAPKSSSGSTPMVGGGIDKLSGSLSSETFVYRQDVVGRKKHEDKLGLVLEVAGDMDSDGSSTDESDSEDDGKKEESHGDTGDAVADTSNGDNLDDGERDDNLVDGQLRVIWTDGNETIEDVGDIKVVDRGFLHGDLVASASNPTGQLGLVVDVSISVDLQAANNEVIKNVSSREIKHIREFSVGDYVVYGPWLGRVDDILDNVTVMFDDGSVCKVVKADPLRLKPLSKSNIDDTDCPYYPGQRVKAVSSSVFRTSRWLMGLWKSTRLEGTVTKVQPGSVVVEWITSALGLDANSSSVPAEEQNPKNLTPLSCFSYANWQLGDWCLLPSVGRSSSVSEDLLTNKPIDSSTRCKSQSGNKISECADDKGNFSNITSEAILDASQLASEVQESAGSLPSEAAMHKDAAMYKGHDAQDVLEHLKGESSWTNPMLEKLDSSKNSQNIDRRANADENSGSECSTAALECGSSSSLVSKESAHESLPAYRKKLRTVFFKKEKKARRRDEDFESAFCIINTTTKVDVAWQDGTKECGVDSKCLIPVQTSNDHDFFPEQYVVEKVANDGDESSEAKRVGVVRSVNFSEKTLCVRWLKPVMRPEDPRGFDYDEIVSAYELVQHPDYDYCYGDVVVRLPSVPGSADTTNFQPMEEQVENSDLSIPGKELSKDKFDGTEQKNKGNLCHNFGSLSWVGNITGLHDGDIEVTWADGTVSTVGPQAVFVVGRDDDGEPFDSDSDDEASWETVDEDQMDNDNDREAGLNNTTENTLDTASSTSLLHEEGTLQNGRLSMPLAALDFIARLTSGIFSRRKKQSDGSGSQEIIKVPELEEADDDLSSEDADTSDSLIEEGEDGVASVNNHELLEESDLVKRDTPVPLESYNSMRTKGDGSGPCNFKQFDSAESPVDHHFLGEGGQTSGGRKWVKKVQQEWSILEKNLPDDIYVRVFEDRMDLLRAVIIGAPGTPYQDGLFFFDFQIPQDYPQLPPSAHYHSGGLRLNPNLYVEGKVCLSLLNTWTGRGNEVWDPSSSSILQVLVSLQGLVLNSKPYFNEAGYEKQVGTIEGEKNSLPYNENAYLLNLKSMMYLLRRPPMHFEEFVKDHFEGVVFTFSKHARHI